MKRRRLCPVLKWHVVNATLHIDTIPVVAQNTLPAYQLTPQNAWMRSGVRNSVPGARIFSVSSRLVSCGMDNFPPGVKQAEREAYNYLREFHY